MPDKPLAFAELGRVVRPGGRVALVDWLTREDPGRAETGLLLRPICEEGHLPSMHAASEYEALLRDAGFDVVGFEDLSMRVWRTWVVVVRRLVPLMLRDRRLAGRLLRSPERVFALSLLRIPLAYRLGSMRLGLLVAERRA
jgi:tocopherol O-methyltransferase